MVFRPHRRIEALEQGVEIQPRGVLCWDGASDTVICIHGSGGWLNIHITDASQHVFLFNNFSRTKYQIKQETLLLGAGFCLSINLQRDIKFSTLYCKRLSQNYHKVCWSKEQSFACLLIGCSVVSSINISENAILCMSEWLYLPSYLYHCYKSSSFYLYCRVFGRY